MTVAFDFPNPEPLPGTTCINTWADDKTTVAQPQWTRVWPYAPDGIPWVEPQSPVSPLTFNWPAPLSRYEFDQLKNEIDQLKARLAELEKPSSDPLRADDV